jgi:hypothetical protein
MSLKTYNGEVWLTVENIPVLVCDNWSGNKVGERCIVWWDRVDGNWTVSKCHDGHLSRRLDIPVEEFFTLATGLHT